MFVLVFFESSELVYDDDIKGSLFIIADRIIDIIYAKYLKKKNNI